MQKRVFISYRRDDTGDSAGRVFDRLKYILPRKNIFFDVDTIAGGENFQKRIEDAIGKSDAVLIFIGDRWAESRPETGQTRLSEATDYVRAELRAALARTILVLPILVAGASMPKPDRLPEDIRSVTNLNALPLRHNSFDYDTKIILERILGSTPGEWPWERKKSRWRDALYVVGGVAVSVVLLMFIVAFYDRIVGLPLEASIGTSFTVLILVVTPILGGWLGWIYARR
jgi:TIR domain